jgi:cytochrome c-type biogenesis protein CcmH
MLFWIIATLMAAAVAATLLPPLLRKGAAQAADTPDVALYRDQLAEIDRDLARGTLAPEEAERTRIEVARRLLAADKAAHEPGGDAVQEAPKRATLIVAAVSGLVVVGGGLWGYAELGAPGYPDIPLAQRIADSAQMRAGRISQAEAEQLVAAAWMAEGLNGPPLPADVPEDYLAMVEDLRTLVPQRPDDLQGWALLALHEARLGQFGAAARAQERVIQLRGDEATEADRIALIDRMVAATQGFVSPEAEQILVGIIDRDPDNIGALYYTGLLYAQTDRPDVAFRLWRQVVETGRSDDQHVELARLQIEDVAFRAGVEYTLPVLSGPDADAIAAARDMDPEAQQAMIEGMVAQLSDRLATEGGSAEEWARLIGAYGVLGDTAQAEAIWVEAQAVFGASEPAMEILREAADRAGVLRQ